VRATCPPRLAPGPAPRIGGETLKQDEKAEVVAKLAERIGATESLIAADYRGLTVQEMADLRASVREHAQVSVVKNTLARRAANEAGREELMPLLEGPTALVWVDGDPALAAKALAVFAKEHNERPALKGGLLEGNALPSAQIVELTKLPSKEVLVAKLVGAIASPIQGLSGVGAPLQQFASAMGNLNAGLARTLEAYRQQRVAAGE
jgi:large subunit ribosomal protein L10